MYTPFRIVVDIDGPNKGNSVLGEDVFVFTLDNTKGLIPFQSWNNTCVFGGGNMNVGAQHSGGGHVSCANKIMLNNWKIPSNYPFFR